MHRPQGSVRGVLPAGRLPHWQKTIKQETLRNWYETHFIACFVPDLSLALLAGCGAAPLPDGLTQKA